MTDPDERANRLLDKMDPKDTLGARIDDVRQAVADDGHELQTGVALIFTTEGFVVAGEDSSADDSDNPTEHQVRAHLMILAAANIAAAFEMEFDHMDDREDLFAILLREQRQLRQQLFDSIASRNVQA